MCCYSKNNHTTSQSIIFPVTALPNLKEEVLHAVKNKCKKSLKNIKQDN